MRPAEDPGAPMPDGPPVADVIYTPREAVAWIRTMTPSALLRAAGRHPRRFPSVKPGQKRGFTGQNILHIIAALAAGEHEADSAPAARAPRSPRRTPVADAPQGVTVLRPRPEARRRSRKAS